MADELSIVTKPKDYFDIVQLQKSGVLEEFLDQPLSYIAETITGALAVGRTGAMVSGGRIVQALLKGKAFKQFGSEFKKLREAGKIPDDFAEKKYGYQTWVELMTIIDEEAPDGDRLEALKAMFFSVNKTSATDAERVAAYQLWQLAKSLRSGELYLLKTIYENRESYFSSLQPNPVFSSTDHYERWASHMAKAAGHGITALIGLHERRLVELCLLTPQISQGTARISTQNARLTDLAFRFFENLENYRVEVQVDGEAE
jgi:hypothetical protein